MSGILSSRGSKSGIITNICDTFPSSGGLAWLNYLVCQYADVNLESPNATSVSNFNSDNNLASAINIRLLTDHTSARGSTNYHWLFGPNYTGHDEANGGWRIELTFRVAVKIEQIHIAPVSTNARPRNFGIYHRPNGTGQTTGQIFFEHQFGRRSDTAGLLSSESKTLFGDARNLVQLENTDQTQIIGYENLIGQTFLITFGNTYYNNGNANAGVGAIRFYGKALTD